VVSGQPAGNFAEKNYRASTGIAAKNLQKQRFKQESTKPRWDFALRNCYYLNFIQQLIPGFGRKEVVPNH